MSDETTTSSEPGTRASAGRNDRKSSTSGFAESSVGKKAASSIIASA